MSRPRQLSKHYVINTSNTSTFILLQHDYMFRSAKTIINTITKRSKYSAIMSSNLSHNSYYNVEIIV